MGTLFYHRLRNSNLMANLTMPMDMEQAVMVAAVNHHGVLFEHSARYVGVA